MNKKSITNAGLVLALLASVSVATPAFAADANNSNSGQYQGAWHGPGQGIGMRGKPGMIKPGVVGTVSSVSGNIINLSGKQGFDTSSATVMFTVDATNAKVMKNNATSSVADIAVGDTLFVQGTTTGTSVTATIIRDGVMMRGQGNNNPLPVKKGFMSNIGQFFRHLFGF